VVRGEARAEIAASLEWRRDTLDRHLGGLRERLGFENTAQLMQALAELKPPAGEIKSA
jgi:DNA-binding CsgD family transcriptional regulator